MPLSLWRHHVVESTIADDGGGVTLVGFPGRGKALSKFGMQAVQISEAVTNALANPSFETNTTGWTNSSLTTFERSTTRAQWGVASLHCISDNTGDNAVSDAVTSMDATDVVVASCWVYVEYGDFKLTIQENNAGWTDKANVTTTTTGQWVYLTVSATLSASVTDARVKVGPGSVAASEFYVDGILFAERTGAVPYCDGSLSSVAVKGARGYAWSGTAHASTSTADTQTASPITYLTANGAVSQYEGSWAGWVNFAADYAYGTDRTIWSLGSSDTDRLCILYGESADKFAVIDGATNALSAAQTFTSNTWIHITATWSKSNNRMQIYVNGTAGTAAASYTPPALSATMIFGAYFSAGACVNGWLTDCQIYNRELSAAEVGKLYATGCGPMTDCTFYASFDGTLQGEVGECISFDGPGPYAGTNYEAGADGVDVISYKIEGTSNTDMQRRQAALEKFIGQAGRRGEYTDLFWKSRGAGGRLARARVYGLGFGRLIGAVHVTAWNANKLLGNSITVTRGPFEGGLYPVTPDKKTVYDYDDGDATNINYTDITGGVVEGTLPGPAVLVMENTSANVPDTVYACLVADDEDTNTAPVTVKISNAEASYVTADDNNTAEVAAGSGTIVRVQFNALGTSDYALDGTAVVADEAAADITGDLTCEARIKLTANSGAPMGIVTKWETTADQNSYALCIDNKRLRGLISFDGKDITDTGASYMDARGSIVLDTARWYHVAMVHSVANGIHTLRIYVEGKLDGEDTVTTASTIASKSAGLYLGTFDGWNAADSINADVAAVSLTGYLDEVRVDDSALYTAPFTAPTAEFGVTDMSYVFHCDDGSGTTITEAGGSGSNAGSYSGGWTIGGYFHPCSVEAQRATWEIPITLTEEYAGRYRVLGVMKLASGQATTDVKFRMRWETTGQFWTTEKLMLTDDNIFELVDLTKNTLITLPWYATPEMQRVEGSMDTAGNRTFGLYTTHDLLGDTLDVDNFYFLKADMMAVIKSASLGQNETLVIDSRPPTPYVANGGASWYLPGGNPSIQAAASPMYLTPGRRHRFLVLWQRSGGYTYNDSILLYAFVKPRYLAMTDSQ